MTFCSVMTLTVLLTCRTRELACGHGSGGTYVGHRDLYLRLRAGEMWDNLCGNEQMKCPALKRSLVKRIRNVLRVTGA